MSATTFFTTTQFLLFFFSLTTITLGDANIQGEVLNPPAQGTEKVSHIHFYFHDSLDGRYSIRIAAAPPFYKSATPFGLAAVVDSPLTEGPDPGSKLVGRAQGLYVIASKEEVGLLMDLTYQLYEGKYNGSSISVLGRNAVRNPLREMPVVGGTGLFRLARGYVQAKNYLYNLTSGLAIVEYDAFVMHY
ncbi:dirigent protein 19-like [Nymphaea colorata]|uniref:Dirigent protein n=1 Tax=Nymphaea colorata TaxID=210225 RepID=A0A5K0V3L7_9MAGN|nr:dirigent protein 19-like [Nymphaea colorata]XP_031473361.1 dirigent protein 19-like [Nymphaea colorata]